MFGENGKGASRGEERRAEKIRERKRSVLEERRSRVPREKKSIWVREKRVMYSYVCRKERRVWRMGRKAIWEAGMRA